MTANLPKSEAASYEELENDLAAMASDPDIQRELRELQQIEVMSVLTHYPLSGPQPASRGAQAEKWHIPDVQRLLLHNIRWKEYELLLEALEQQHLRLTYDRGNLEIMTLSSEHEGFKSLAGLFVHVLAEECGVAVKNLGSTTYRREDRDRGLEPDECYYTKNWLRIRGKKRIDLSVDPPPDLVVEVDITSSSLDRMAIYAEMGVPEIWRFDGEVFTVNLLGNDKKYIECDRSPTFPAIAIMELARFLQQGQMEDDAVVALAFRAWVREQLAQATR